MHTAISSSVATVPATMYTVDCAFDVCVRTMCTLPCFVTVSVDCLLTIGNAVGVVCANTVILVALIVDYVLFSVVDCVLLDVSRSVLFCNCFDL